MASPQASYGSALRAATSVSLSAYDRETLLAFVADLFRKEYGDVERDADIMSQAKARSN